MKHGKSAREMQRDPSYQGFFSRLPKSATEALHYLDQKDREAARAERTGKLDNTDHYVPASYTIK